MTLDEYQRLARVYRLPSANELYAVLGLAGEVGELYSLFAKSIRDGGCPAEAPSEALKKELGDIMWFVAAIADDVGYDLSEVALGNIDKLKSRSARGVLKGSGDDR